jgi:hypothetical protein
VFAAGEVSRVEGKTFTPGDAEVGLVLRVRAVYKDANGVLEGRCSPPRRRPWKTSMMPRSAQS